MSDATPEKPLDPRVATLRVVLIVLLVVGAAVLVYAFVQKPAPEWRVESMPISALTYVLVAAAALLVLGFWIVPSMWVTVLLGPIVRGELPPEKMNDTGTWLKVYVAQSVLGYVFLVAATAALAFGYMQEGVGWLFVGGVVFLIFMGMQYPTREGVNRWLTSQWEWVKQQQQNKPQ